jgi:F-box-like
MAGITKTFWSTVLVTCPPARPVPVIEPYRSLLNLPVEVLLMILSQLDSTEDLNRISETCRLLRSLYQESRAHLLQSLWARSSTSYSDYKDIYEAELQLDLGTPGSTGVNLPSRRHLMSTVGFRQVTRRAKALNPSDGRAPEIFALVEGGPKLSLRAPYHIKVTMVYNPKSPDGSCNQPILLRLSDGLLRRIEDRCIYPWLFLQRTDCGRYREIPDSCGCSCSSPCKPSSGSIDSEGCGRHWFVPLAPGESYTFTTTFWPHLFRRHIGFEVGASYCLAYGGRDHCLCLQQFVAYHVSAASLRYTSLPSGMVGQN